MVEMICKQRTGGICHQASSDRQERAQPEPGPASAPTDGPASWVPPCGGTIGRQAQLMAGVLDTTSVDGPQGDGWPGVAARRHSSADRGARYPPVRLLARKMLLGSLTCTPRFGLSTSWVTATCPAILTS